MYFIITTTNVETIFIRNMQMKGLLTITFNNLAKNFPNALIWLEMQLY